MVIPLPSRLLLKSVLGVVVFTCAVPDHADLLKPTAHQPALEFLEAWDAELQAWDAQQGVRQRVEHFEALATGPFGRTTDALEDYSCEVAALERNAADASAEATVQWVRWRELCTARDQAARERSAKFIWARLWAAAHPEPAAGTDLQPEVH